MHNNPKDGYRQRSLAGLTTKEEEEIREALKLFSQDNHYDGAITQTEINERLFELSNTRAFTSKEVYFLIRMLVE